MRDRVICLISHDVLLGRLFERCHMDCRYWCDRIVCVGEWATTFDIMVLVYLTNWNIVTVGNYLNGFIINDINLDLRIQLQVEENFCGVNVLHVLFHRFGSPLEKISEVNHFAFLERFPEPKLSLCVNTIAMHSSIDIEYPNFRWTEKRQLELYKCYCIANKRNLPANTGIHTIWKDRNHDSPQFDPNYLIRMKDKFENQLKGSDKKDIMLNCCDRDMIQG